MNHPQRVVELAGNDFRLAGVVVKVLLLAGDFEMAAAGEVAVDRFLAHDLFDAIHGRERGGVHALGPLAPVHRDELVYSEFHPGKDHPAIARTGAPADGFAFQHGNFRAALGKCAGGRKAGETCPDHGYIDYFRDRA